MNFTKTILQESLKMFTPKRNSLPFFWYDCVIVFVTIFIFNLLSGIYFNYFARKQSTTTDYLMGGRTMKVLPVAVSLVASHTSANTFMAVPADVYRYGAGYLLGGLSTLIAVIVTIYVYLPVFYNLRVTSVYEYLERRFDEKTRLLASFLSVLSYILYLPIVIYVPSLAYSAATGTDVHFMATAICGLCLFYSTLGGLKAVVWTDTIQFTIAVFAITLVFFLGLQSTGGLSTVWEKGMTGKRLDIFDFGLDPTKRDSFWSISIGFTTLKIAGFSVSQSCVQKYLAVPTFRQSVLCVIYFGIGTTIVKTLTIFLGLLIYAKYSDCDPLLTQKITTDDQLAAYFVMDVSKNIPGLSGLFIAGVFSASLSTLSADLNCLAGIIYTDFISKLSSKKITEKTATFILKLTVIICGIICNLLVYAAEHLGGLFSLGLSLAGITVGSVLGIFTLGILFPKANTKGAFYGGICGLVAVSCIIIPAEYYQMEGLLKHPSLPVSASGCNSTHDIMSSVNTKEAVFSKQVPSIFKISFYYYGLVGSTITLVSGLLISYLTNSTQQPVDKKFISPLYYTLLKTKDKKKTILL